MSSDEENVADKLFARLAERDAERERERANQQVKSKPSSQTPSNKDGKKKNRSQLKKERKALQIQEIQKQAENESMNQIDLGKEEDELMVKKLSELKLKENEIEPDGHCLFNAFADQLRLRYQKESNYLSLRTDAVNYIRKHPDDFLPFLYRESDGEVFNQNDLKEYLDKMEHEAIWGGQIEIMALSKFHNVPVNVVQADIPILKIGEDEFSSKSPIWLAYRRHRYGLGEHYNSLNDV